LINNNAVIIKNIGGLYSVYKEGVLYSCRARGIFRKESIKPMIGDYVVLSDIVEEDKSAIIDDILPRKNILVRPAVANIDCFVLVIAAVSPMPDLLLVDKLLAVARLKGMDVLMIINKSDQSASNVDALVQQYSNAVSKLAITCALKGEGIDEITSYLSGRISVMAGQSGAGKSSLLNDILKREAMVTGALSVKTEKGKQTTRHSEMFMFGNEGFVIDSPGFSLFEISNINSENLQNLYPEMYNNAEICRFPDCAHIGEPDCFVKDLVEKGIFNRMRYERYKTIYKEIKLQERNKYK